MTNSALLIKKIDESGLKKGYLVKKLDTSYKWLGKKINNEKDFTASEIDMLCELLNICDLEEKDRIFFAKDVEKSST